MPKGRGAQQRHRPRAKRGKTAGGTASGRLQRDSLQVLSSKARRERHLKEVMSLRPTIGERSAGVYRKTTKRLQKAYDAAISTVLRRNPGRRN